MRKRSQKQVVVLGSVPLAVRVARRLSEHPHVKIAGIVASEKPISEWRSGASRTPMIDYARQEGIKCLSLSDLCKGEYDVGFTVKFHRIVRHDVIGSFRSGIVNFHGGWLPQYRGVDAPVHAILNNEKYFGVTLHLVDEGVDTGDILFRASTEIEERDTSYTLYLKSEIMLWALFSGHLDEILSGKVETIAQDKLIKEEGTPAKTYKRSDLKGLREVCSSDSAAETLRKVRAFDFPGHEQAWFRLGKHRIFLTLGEEPGPPKSAEELMDFNENGNISVRQVRY